VSKAGDKASTAKERSLDKQCSSFMQKICQKYDNVAEVDKLAAVARKVDTVKLVMQENVDQALRNCVQLESIEKAAGACSFDTFVCVPRCLSAVCLLCCVVVRASGGLAAARWISFFCAAHWLETVTLTLCTSGDVLLVYKSFLAVPHVGGLCSCCGSRCGGLFCWPHSAHLSTCNQHPH
jgi:hypothetical protein